jgi:hypothetical protein
MAPVHLIVRQFRIKGGHGHPPMPAHMGAPNPWIAGSESGAVTESPDKADSGNSCRHHQPRTARGRDTFQAHLDALVTRT